MSKGTTTIPPPTPKSAPKNPATSPMATKRTPVSYEACLRSNGSRKLPSSPAIRLDVDGTLAPIAPAPGRAGTE